jgi:putative phage-type endonuclease
MAQPAFDDVVTSVPPAPFAATCRATGIHSRDREQWLRARRHGMTGSEVAAILNLHPYKSALEVYAEKVGLAPANDVHEAALWGQLFEPAILAEYGRRSGRVVVPSGELLQSKAREWWLVTPDGLQLEGPNMPAFAVGPGLVEVKTTGSGPAWHEEIPAYVQVQVQHQLLVTGALWNTLAWLPFPERELQWYDVAPHREFQAMLGAKCDEFWLRVLERRPPDPDGSDSARRAILAMNPRLDDDIIDFDESAVPIADELDQISATIKQLEARKDLISNRVLHVLGEQKAGLLPDGRYWNSWITEASESRCSCGQVHTSRKGFRACRLMAPRKKPHPLPVGTRSLSLKPSDEIADLLRASLELVKRGEP